MRCVSSRFLTAAPRFSAASSSSAASLRGIEFSPRDLRLGLVEAAEGKMGNPIDQLLLFCYHYDPVTGTYGPFVTNLVRVAGLITVIGLAAFILWMLRRERTNAGAAGRPA